MGQQSRESAYFLENGNENVEDDDDEEYYDEDDDDYDEEDYYYYDDQGSIDEKEKH